MNIKDTKLSEYISSLIDIRDKLEANLVSNGFESTNSNRDLATLTDLAKSYLTYSANIRDSINSLLVSKSIITSTVEFNEFEEIIRTYIEESIRVMNNATNNVTKLVNSTNPTSTEAIVTNDELNTLSVTNTNAINSLITLKGKLQTAYGGSSNKTFETLVNTAVDYITNISNLTTTFNQNLIDRKIVASNNTLSLSGLMDAVIDKHDYVETTLASLVDEVEGDSLVGSIVQLTDDFQNDLIDRGVIPSGSSLTLEGLMGAVISDYDSIESELSRIVNMN